MSTPTPPPRRRFKRRYVVGLCLLLATVAAVAWCYRPLTSRERKLVGHWLDNAEPWTGLEFTSDRKVNMIVFRNGGWDRSIELVSWWRLSGNRLTIRNQNSLETASLVKKAWAQLASEGEVEPLQLEDDELEFFGHSYHRQKISLSVPTP
jgi:hypothetical protein